MGKFIELIGQLKPKNNGNFPIADVNDLKGGYIQLDSVSQLNEHTNSGKVKQGMLAYVAETNGIYQYQQGLWIPWIGGSGEGGGGASIIKVEHLEDLQNSAIKITGQLVYVEEIKDLRYFDGESWKSFTRIYIQPTPPEDKGGIWIDTSDEKKYDSSNGVIINMLQAVSILQEKIRRLEWALANQLDFGDFTNNHYQEYDDYVNPVQPDFGTDTEEDLWKLSDNLLTTVDEIEPTEFKSLVPTAKHLSIKGGTYAQMIENKNNFLPNELLWCDDRKQLWIKDKRTSNLIQIGSSGGITPEPDAETMEQILTQVVGSGLNAKTKIVGIEFGDMNNPELTYRLSVKDGEIDLHDYRLDKSNLAGNAQTVVSGEYYSRPFFPILSDFTGNVNSPMIYINSIYCGGDSDSKSYNPCSHNFIELTNLTNVDLNLKGLYLHYTEKNTGQWVSLPLKGVIKPKGTFLIRGSQCSVIDINTTIIKVPTYDIEWKKSETYNPDVLQLSNPTEYNIWDEKGLIRFSNNCAFYLSGEESVDYYKTNTLVDSAPWSNVGVKKWYVDLVGIGSHNGTNMPNEFAPIPNVGKNNLYFRYHSMDFISQAVKATTARKNSVDWTYIDLNVDNPKLDKQMYIPKASYESKNVFYNKTKLTDGAPNIITCSFGQNAHTTRTFNWISKGYYDEYIWFANEDGEYLEENKFESFKEGDGRTSNKNWNDPLYNRIRGIATDGTAFTVHKFMKDWDEVTEETVIKYKVGKDNAWSNERSLTLRNRDAVIDSGFTFLNVTDQQGFNPEELETWRVSAEFINNDRINNDFDWVINTGDQTQNGNRIGEWIDYFKGGDSILKDKEQMFVIGNNDLAPEDMYILGNGGDLSKINSHNTSLFYTFEHPYEVPRSTLGFYIPSVYSFIYGDTYFLSMNSEISSLTSSIIFNQPQGTNVYTDDIKPWAERDLINCVDSKIKWKNAFNHESPFTIITAETIMSYVKAEEGGTLVKDLSVERGGSRINTVGNYWFSQFLQDNGFSVVLCGHKHTFANSRYIYDDKNLTMEPIVYDPDYDPDEGIYPAWYNALPEREKMCVRLSNDSTSRNYVRYVMGQATGYKLSSNKELPAQNTPWLMEYYPVISQVENPLTNTATVALNPGQMFPHYIIWNIGKGTETETSESGTAERDRIIGKPYKIVLANSPTTRWAYKYNTPILANQLTKDGGNGSINPTNNIIIEKL